MSANTGAFRGPSPYEGTGFGTGGNQVMEAATGKVAQGSLNGWHPTVVYLLVLLVIEWALFVLLSKYI